MDDYQNLSKIIKTQSRFSITNDKKFKGRRESGTFLTRGDMKNLNLGKYPHLRADHFHIAYIFDIVPPKAQNCEKHVFFTRCLVFVVFLGGIFG